MRKTPKKTCRTCGRPTKSVKILQCAACWNEAHGVESTEKKD